MNEVISTQDTYNETYAMSFTWYVGMCYGMRDLETCGAYGGTWMFDSFNVWLIV